MSKPEITIHDSGTFKTGRGRFENGKFVLPVAPEGTRQYSLEQTRIHVVDSPDLVGHYVPGVAHLVLPAGEGTLVLGRMETLFIARFDDGKDMLASMDRATFNHLGLDTRVVPMEPGSGLIIPAARPAHGCQADGWVPRQNGLQRRR